MIFTFSHSAAEPPAEFIGAFSTPAFIAYEPFAPPFAAATPPDGCIDEPIYLAARGRHA